jgi:allophanate hydrolase
VALSDLSFDLASLRQAYAHDGLSAAALVAEVLARVAAAGEDHVWIARVAEDALHARAAVLDAEPRARRARLPLFGVPFAVKDNIDVAGMATTAGCPAFAYTADATAPAVERLLQAGAILVGKTNLDQFATGLVGTRSPYGVPRNPFDPSYIPGGSSSGSAVAVAAGLVSFALGTDTAGSGRVPAAINNIVGWKPTRGRISTRGVVPACRSLDCVSAFALTAADAAAIDQVCGVYDTRDPFARQTFTPQDPFEPPFRYGMPISNAEDDEEAWAAVDDVARALDALGGTFVPLDIAPLRAAGELLYSGPWVAERLTVVETLLARAPEALLPVTREIIAAAAKFSAVDAFKAQYRLAELANETLLTIWYETQILLLPTVPRLYRIDEIAADPIGRNAHLGLYTNFANLLDLAAIALPAGFREDGLPLGASLTAPAFSDASLLKLGRQVQDLLGLPLGAPRRKDSPQRHGGAEKR